MRIHTYSWGRFVIRAVILFIVIAGGVFVGIYIATATGINDSVNLQPLTPTTLENRTGLELNPLWPLFAAADTAGRPVILDTVLNGHKTVVGFVAEGCEACRLFLERFAGVSNRAGDDLQLILLTQDPGFFVRQYGVRAFQVSPQAMDDQGIHSFPTIVGVNERGKVVFVSSGFPTSLTTGFAKKYLR
jgi:thiol-disulfide isomerase/thioredoxin